MLRHAMMRICGCMHHGHLRWSLQSKDARGQIVRVCGCDSLLEKHMVASWKSQKPHLLLCFLREWIFLKIIEELQLYRKMQPFRPPPPPNCCSIYNHKQHIRSLQTKSLCFVPNYCTFENNYNLMLCELQYVHTQTLKCSYVNLIFGTGSHRELCELFGINQRNVFSKKGSQNCLIKLHHWHPEIDLEAIVIIPQLL